jgi:putative PIN family toxin of toxin-antitoxin system
MPSKQRLSARIRLEDIENVVALIKQDGLWIEPAYVPAVSPDPKDDVFLACAVTAKADFLITGDTRDLLPLNEHMGTKIITPAQFLQILQPIG